MRLIIGLGNPGKQYDTTRHNAGFLALDFLRSEFHFDPFQREERFDAETTSGLFEGEKILLAKPQAFMNASGKSVRALLDFYKLDPAHLCVIHDDLDIAPGTLKTTLSSRSAGHNGVADIIETLDTQDFMRIRLGIGRPTETNGICIPSHDYVLQNFSEDEQKKFEALFPEILPLLRTFITKENARRE